ncbi:MAG TPA: serine hydrolase [Candidatus Paceibacterota bacterium]|nr:serine hydrolase [Candidatus Paceibacterota bacterium]
MGTPRSVGLDQMLARHRERQMRQMGIALLGFTTVLAIAVMLAPRPAPEPVGITALPAQPEVNAYEGVVLVGKAAVVYDLATGETLFERNAKAQLPLASLTKLLTIYAASDTLPPDALVSITDSALAAEGESGFVAGEAFRYSDLAQLAIVSSSNDATQAIAETAAAKRALPGQNLLASAVAAVGLSQTYALNGTGLDESISVAGGYGSAVDIARLAGALLSKAPEIAHASTRTVFSIQSLAGVTHTLPNTNPEVGTIPNILLSKTGFTDLAGGNLVVVYDAGIGHPIAIVVLGSTRDGRFRDVDLLLDRTLARFAGITPS